MADITWDDVTDLQANLSAAEADAQTKILAYVNGELNPDAFGGADSARFVMARIYLAAHLGELARRNGERSVSSKLIGAERISIAYGLSTEGLAQTSWGAEYAEMLAASPLRIGAGTCR